MFGAYRLILAALVALSHFGLVKDKFNPGQWSVLSFYVVSGFIMEHQFRKLSVAGEKIPFYVDRFMRIFPLYFGVLLICVAGFRPPWRIIWLNGCLFPLNYSEFNGIPALIAPSWSLACEAHFYLLVPFIAACSTGTIRWLAAASVALFIVSPVLPHSTFWAYVGLPGILFAFLSGILIRRNDTLSLRVLWAVFAVLLTVFGYSKIAHWGLPTGIHINVCVGYLVALPVVSRLAKLSPKNKWDQRLGLLSYPLFLIHDPLRELAAPYFPHLNMLGWLILSVIAAVLLVIILERPVDRVRYRLRKGRLTETGVKTNALSE